MNDNTTKLLEQLAQKLGTTAEYLWSVLIKQAAISAATDLIYLFIAVIIGFGLYKLYKVFSKDKGELLGLVMIVLTLFWIILFAACFFSISNIINGFFNPEYWALQQVLDTLK